MLGTDLIDAMAKIDDRLIIMLNPDGLFAGVELARRQPTS